MAARLLPLVAGALVALAVGQGPTSLAVEEQGLRHRAQVFTRDGRAPAPEGSVLLFERVLSPREVSPGQRHLFDCGQAAISRGSAEFMPAFTADCPPGSKISVSVKFPDERPGFSGIVAESVPPIEWRTARPGEAEPRLVVIRPIPPQTGDVVEGTGGVSSGAAESAAHQSSGSDAAVYAGVILASLVVAALAIATGVALRRRAG